MSSTNQALAQAGRRSAPAEPADHDTEATGQTGSLLADLRSTGGGGADGASELPQAPRGRRRLPTQHLVTVVVLVAGGGALVAMRQFGIGAGMRFDATERLDYVQPVSQKRSSEQDRVLGELQRGVAAAPPIPVHIEQNPFLLDLRPAASEVVQSGPSDEEQAARRSAEEFKRRKEAVATALAGVVLNGVMGGQTPVARVNGELVKVGDTVAGIFTVVAIDGRNILLDADGQVYTVEMSQESTPKHAPQVRTRTPGK